MPENNYYANYNMHGKEWERLVNFEYFDKDGTRMLNQNLGARIHGGGSRNRAQKTLRLYARNDYGEEYINHHFFINKDIESFKRLLLRSPTSTDAFSMFKDELCHDIIKDIDLDIQSSALSIVFINGEYWGIHSIRERQDKYYLEENYNIDVDNIDIIADNKEVIDGDDNNYTELISYIETNSLTNSENYEYIKTQIDIESFINYQLVQLYYANTDWPFHNIKYWRQKSSDSKWRWFFFDCDRCMVDYGYNQLIEYNREHIYTQLPDWARIVFSSLLKNDEFRNQFFQKFIYHINSTFEPERVINKIEEYELMYEPLMTEHINR